MSQCIGQVNRRIDSRAAFLLTQASHTEGISQTVLSMLEAYGLHAFAHLPSGKAIITFNNATLALCNSFFQLGAAPVRQAWKASHSVSWSLPPLRTGTACQPRVARCCRQRVRPGSHRAVSKAVVMKVNLTPNELDQCCFSSIVHSMECDSQQQYGYHVH